MAIPSPSPPGAPIQPAEQQQDQQTTIIDDDIKVDLPVQPLPAHQPAPQLPQPQPEQPLPVARRTVAGLFATPLAMNKAYPKEVRDSLFGKSCLIRTSRRTCLPPPGNMQYKRLSKTQLPLQHPTTWTYSTGTKR